MRTLRTAVRGLVEFLRDRGAGSAAVSGPGRFPEAVLPEIADPACGILCFNDNDNITDWQQRAEIVKTAIAEKLNIKH